jgi:hypothetical protein
MDAVKTKDSRGMKMEQSPKKSLEDAGGGHKGAHFII